MAALIIDNIAELEDLGDSDDTLSELSELSRTPPLEDLSIEALSKASSHSATPDSHKLWPRSNARKKSRIRLKSAKRKTWKDYLETEDGVRTFTFVEGTWPKDRESEHRRPKAQRRSKESTAVTEVANSESETSNAEWVAAIKRPRLLPTRKAVRSAVRRKLLSAKMKTKRPKKPIEPARRKLELLDLPSEILLQILHGPGSHEISSGWSGKFRTLNKFCLEVHDSVKRRALDISLPCSQLRVPPFAIDNETLSMIMAEIAFKSLLASPCLSDLRQVQIEYRMGHRLASQLKNIAYAALLTYAPKLESISLRGPFHQDPVKYSKTSSFYIKEFSAFSSLQRLSLKSGSLESVPLCRLLSRLRLREFCLEDVNMHDEQLWKRLVQEDPSGHAVALLEVISLKNVITNEGKGRIGVVWSMGDAAVAIRRMKNIRSIRLEQTSWISRGWWNPSAKNWKARYDILIDLFVHRQKYGLVKLEELILPTGDNVAQKLAEEEESCSVAV